MSRSIRLSEEASERLGAHGREDETFSDVVLRLAGERSLLELAGILDDEGADALRDAVAGSRPADVDVGIDQPRQPQTPIAVRNHHRAPKRTTLVARHGT